MQHQEEWMNMVSQYTPGKSTAFTNLDFADDISLLLDVIVQAQKLLSCVERECKKVGLSINAKTTECLSINIENPTLLYTTDSTELEFVVVFKYLGSWIKQTERNLALLVGSQWHDSHIEVHSE
jgi:hypothetical protein